jgi:hypothetical protein
VRFPLVFEIQAPFAVWVQNHRKAEGPSHPFFLTFRTAFTGPTRDYSTFCALFLWPASGCSQHLVFFFGPASGCAGTEFFGGPNKTKQALVFGAFSEFSLHGELKNNNKYFPPKLFLKKLKNLKQSQKI